MIVFGLSTPNFLLFDEVQYQCHFVVVIGSSHRRRAKSPLGTVLIINLLGKGLTSRACMGDGGSIWWAPAPLDYKLRNDRYILFSTSTDSPSTPLYFQKFFNGTFLNYWGTVSHSSKRPIAHWPPKSQFTLLANNQNGTYTCEVFLCPDSRYYLWFLTR